MQEKLSLYWLLSLYAFKSFYRAKSAVLFTLLFPIGFLVVFGLLNFGNDGQFSIGLGVADNAANERSRQLIAALEEVDVLDITTGSESGLRAEVEGNDRNVVLVIPAGFDFDVANGSTELQFLYNPDPSRIANLTTAQTVTDAVLRSLFNEANEVPPEFLLNSAVATAATPLSTSGDSDSGGFSYVVFLLPGILAFSVMQTGVFGIVFTIVRFKATGLLRRLQATPVGPVPILASQGAANFAVVAIQTVVLIAVALNFGDVREELCDLGVLSIVYTLIASVIGAVTFVSLGLLASAAINNERAGGGLANLITFPQMFLSGVFFPLDTLPDWLSSVTRFLPLSFLVELLRDGTRAGLPLWDGEVALNILGLAVWAVVFFVAARFLFRWS